MRMDAEAVEELTAYIAAGSLSLPLHERPIISCHHTQVKIGRWHNYINWIFSTYILIAFL